jgi:hypothetical protein
MARIIRNLSEGRAAIQLQDVAPAASNDPKERESANALTVVFFAPERYGLFASPPRSKAANYQGKQRKILFEDRR